jgi:hypothetical protein
MALLPVIYQKKTGFTHGFLLSSQGGEAVSSRALAVQRHGPAAVAL